MSVPLLGRVLHACATGDALKRQGKQQTATVAVALAPGKIEPQ
jgi:hypothetical protein